MHGVREVDLVAGIVEGLRYRGRLVLRCGQWRADRAGNDGGLPDLIVWDPDRQAWIGIEVKTPEGRVRPSQRALVASGCVIVVRSIEEAFAAVGEALDGTN